MVFTLLLSAFQKIAFAGLLFCTGFASYFTTPPAEGSGNEPLTETSAKVAVIKGIDVSRWQKEVDWMLVKEADITFAFVKATQDDFRRDPFFERNWEETKCVGITRGAYHYFTPNTPVQGQIDIFTSTVILEPGDLPPVLDVEVATKGMSGEELRQNIRVWLEAVQAHYGVKPIIYTNQNFYRRWLQGYFQDFHFWIARYSPTEPETHETDKWFFWQYSDRGRIPGIKAAVDMNHFAGDLEAFNTLCLPEMMASGSAGIDSTLKHIDLLGTAR
jgi:lysozyme